MAVVTSVMTSTLDDSYFLVKVTSELGEVKIPHSRMTKAYWEILVTCL